MTLRLLTRRNYPSSFGFVALFLTCGLSCATPYERLSGKFGYDDFRITDDTFEVSFSGNSHTPHSTVSRYVFRRAAEVCLENGFSHFAPIMEEDRTLYGSLNTASGTTHTYSNQQGGSGSSYGSGSGLNIPFEMPGSSMRVRCFKGEVSENDALIDARAFLSYNSAGSAE